MVVQVLNMMIQLIVIIMEHHTIIMDQDEVWDQLGICRMAHLNHRHHHHETTPRAIPPSMIRRKATKFLKPNATAIILEETMEVCSIICSLLIS